MTPSEKIIVRFYAGNTFMYKSNDGKNENEKQRIYKAIQKALEIELNVNYSGI